MSEVAFQVRYNRSEVPSIAAFAGVTGDMNGACKDVYFLRGIGCNASYLADIRGMDTLLQARGQGAYLRLDALPRLCRPEDISALCTVYDGWVQGSEAPPRLAVAAQNAALGDALTMALIKVRALFRKSTPGITESIEKNFMLKLFLWADQTLAPLLVRWIGGTDAKFVLTGPIKKPEYLFCYMLTLLGIDVLMLSPGGPIDLPGELLSLSVVMHLGAAGEIKIPSFAAAAVSPQPRATTAPVARSGVDIRRPDRERAPRVAAPVVSPVRTRVVPAVSTPALTVPSTRQELAFEQLALLASSIVMIEVHDDKGEAVSSGSGIMVGEAGFILTNHHVACKGSRFSVHIEDDSAVYQTDEVIKTHALLDLAIIRIQRKLRPIPIYQQAAPIVRGQRVVAIGSPLGLFNSVSDGIISGFRTIDEVDMIQFTAPTSPGSSGGAVLNMFGEVIGISTAGIDRGQNINLAVGYQNIFPFIKGFCK